MILEQGILPVISGKEEQFETAFAEAKTLIANSPGCLSVQLSRCIETPNEYLLQVQWERLEDHTEGFRGSEAFGRWRELLWDFYEPKPVMHHFQLTAEEPGVARR